MQLIIISILTFIKVGERMDIERELIKISDPDFPIRACFVKSSEVDLSSKTHLHKAIELVYVFEGEMEFKINNDIVQVQSGNILMINGLTAHSSIVTNPSLPTKMYLLQFDPSLILGNNVLSDYKYLAPFLNEKSHGYNPLDLNTFPEYRAVADLVMAIAGEMENKALAYELYIKACLYNILTILYRNNLINFSSLDKLSKNKALLSKLDKAFKLVENHYQENITVQMACDELSFNYHYFCRLFKCATGKTFIQYLNFVRIKHVEKLILTTEKTITQIMCDTGFSSLNYLNRIFKSYNGITPSAFRKEVIKIK